MLLHSGGAVLVLEQVLNDTKDGPLMTLIFDLGMLVSSDGRERTALEYTQLLEKHHFGGVKIKLLPEARFRDAILAHKVRPPAVVGKLNGYNHSCTAALVVENGNM